MDLDVKCRSKLSCFFNYSKQYNFKKSHYSIIRPFKIYDKKKNQDFPSN